MSQSLSAPDRLRRNHGHGAIQPPPLLPPVSLLDCVVFCVFLAPQLLIQAGPYAAIVSVLQALPFLIFQMPVDVAQRQWASWRLGKTVRPSLFEDVVLCCVRWAFIHMDTRVGRVFFSRPVALPFFKLRQLQATGISRLFQAAVAHALSTIAFLLPPFASPHLTSSTTQAVPSLYWQEYHDEKFEGMWIRYDLSRPSDIVIFFIHGGGFALGSSHFYLEFLMTWAALLMEGGSGYEKSARFSNPAIFSLDYTLAPDAVFPAQIDEAAHAYAHVLSTAAHGDPARIVVAGDSAGGTIILSLLLRLSQTSPSLLTPLPLPGMAVLISPWVSLWSHRYRRSANDYIDADSLVNYAALYAGKAASQPGTTQPETLSTKSETDSGVEPLLSPGHCHEAEWWRRACPSKGMFITYGEEEVFAPEIRAWAEHLQADGVDVQTSVDGRGLGVHAWPVASLFLARSNAQRFEGLCRIAREVKQRMAKSQS